MKRVSAAQRLVPYLAEATDGPFTLGEIYRRMTQSDVRAVFKRELAKPSLALSIGCRTALSDFAGGSDNSFADIKKTITNVLGLWLNPVVDAATAVSDFDLRDLRKRRMSIYLGVSPDELDRIAPLYNLLFQQLIDLNVRDLPDETTPVPVLVILDEFARLGRASVNRLFELGLGDVALAFTATSSKTDQLRIAELVAAHGAAGFADAWLRHRGAAWAADMLSLAKAALISTVLGVGAELGSGSNDALTRALRTGTQDTINQSGQQIVRRQLNVTPTLTIRPGFPVRVIVTKDLILAPIGDRR